jgi:hypothetical protein
LLGVVGALALAASAAPAFGARSSGRAHFAPDAVAFLDPLHGVLAGSDQTGDNCTPACNPKDATISLTSDGGRSWHVVFHAPRPALSVTAFQGALWARLDDGETFSSNGGGRRWRPAVPPRFASDSTCPIGSSAGINAGSQSWSLCTGEPGAGTRRKAVYRNEGARSWVRVAHTSIEGRGYGGIASYGYAVGIAGAETGGFGIVWESRGTLYVTRDGGRHWSGLPRVAEPEVDFGQWADVLPKGVGFVILERSGRSWLIETVDAGRTWRVVHRWEGAA